MSLNKYNATTGELENIASGQRTWVGTRAAYDAAKQAGTLPTNALICITDDEEDYCHYSTEETKTGNYWIDGKPIYRKVYQETFGISVGQQKNIDVTSWNIDNPVHVDFIYKDGANGTPTTIITHSAMNGILFSKTEIRVNIPSSSGWSLGSALQTFVCEYTKTTD